MKSIIKHKKCTTVKPNNMYLFILIFIFILAVLFFLLIRKSSPIKFTENVDLSKVFPISQIEKDIIINGNGDLTIGYDLLLPDVFSLSETQLDSIHDSFVGIFKTLPNGAIIHKQDLFFLAPNVDINMTSSKIIKENTKHYYGRPKLQQISRIFLTLPKSNSFVNKNDSSLLYKPNYLFKNNLTADTANFEKLSKNFEMSINSIIGFKAIRLTENNLVNSIYGYINGSWGTPPVDSSFSVNPISIDDNGNFKVGDTFLRVISLTDEGDTISNSAIPKISPSSTYENGINFSNVINTKTSFIFPLAAGLPVDHVLNTRIQILDNDFVLGKLKTEAKNMGYLGTFYPTANYKAAKINLFINAVNEHRYQCCLTDVSVILRSNNLSELDKYSSICQNHFIQLNKSRAYVENFDTANIIFSNIPGAPNLAYRGFYSTTAHSTCYINKESMIMNDVHGITLLDRFGAPVIVDFFNNKATTNRNKIVLGPSGSGKSYALNSIISQYFELGHHIIIVDIGYSYKRNCELNNGKHFDSINKKSFSFNLFYCDKNSNGDYIYKNTDDDDSFGRVDTITNIILFLAKGTNPISPIELGIFKKSVSDYFEYCNQNKVTANFTHYFEVFLSIFDDSLNKEHKFIFKINDLKILFEPFIYGEHKHLLNSADSIDIANEQFVVFDLESVEKDPVIFPLLVILIMDLTIQKMMRLDGTRLTFLIDEALNFLQDPKMGPFMAYLFRTIRKKEGEIIIAAQNVMFLDSADPITRGSIIINSDYNILLDHSKFASNYIDIKRVLSFTDHQISMLDSLRKGDGYREFFVKLGSLNCIYRMEVSPYADAVYTTHKTESFEIETLALENKSLETGILQYLENKFNKSKH